ncbi:aromatic ring-hydroxylating dioxygenase subunit alpha [Bradyrhizobium sp.]|jgi:phenylpropionate dioxygenase-like ring-hydroxylating dioxygenase large terminal subunit|uniref:aromatic ring-hydroxylating dioxygenase subunit alpha n=1 Tax=Bradyrhizobium sp. TaxID=376 RepID=UPI002DDD72A8|nr:aromatic ring-hydroxylating dioxygenase subunit alpha [Bradyrhizobium sp.]HEV2157859.1 aromatic ring-hydroxylating dioxygenase subunit alpha [Bradyrhizobium sp.]
MVIASTWDTARADYRAIINEWHVVRRSEEVAEDAIVPACLLGEDIILWRHDGEVHAWKDYCRHRGARLSLGWVKDGCVVCPYHGWEYGTDGACRRYPAHPTTRPTSRAAAFRHHAVERYGYIWVCMGNPVAAVPPFPVWEDASYRKVQAGPYYYNANALRAVENFLDPAHFPFVHANLNGNPDDPDELVDYDVVLTDEGLRTSEITLFQPYGDHRGIPINAVYHYYCFRPTTAYFNKKTGEVERFCTFMAVTPVDLENCVLHLTAAINYGFDVAVEQIVARLDKVYEQDRVIVESQRPKTLPLHPKDEIHLRSDLLGVEYRRWLRALAGDGPDAGSAQEPAAEGAVAN